MIADYVASARHHLAGLVERYDVQATGQAGSEAGIRAYRHDIRDKRLLARDRNGVLS